MRALNGAVCRALFRVSATARLCIPRAGANDRQHSLAIELHEWGNGHQVSMASSEPPSSVYRMVGILIVGSRPLRLSKGEAT
jgi:hypothetical protein